MLDVLTMLFPKFSCAILVLAASTGTVAADDTSRREILVPEGWQGAYDFGYAPAIKVDNWVIISGIPAGGPGTYEEKIRRMYQRAGQLLEAAGATFADVVELQTFHVDPEDSAAFGAEFERYMPIHREFFGDHRPAWTAVGTTALLASTAPVEMRVVAVIGSARNSRVVTGASTTP